MSQSREALAMDIGFGKPRGFFVSRIVAVVIGVAFVAAIVTTALLCYYLSPCESESSVKSTTDEFTRVSTSSPDVSTTAPPKIDVRLPTSLVPEYYRIKLIPYIVENNFTFDGEVEIHMICNASTSNITLHINDMTIEESSVVVKSLGDNSANLAIADHAYDKPRQFYLIHLKEELAEGTNYSVKIKFIGKLNNDLAGFYRSSYVQNGQTRWVATTQFQPTDARRAFPCFDEPGLKAKFEISIGRETASNYTSISNMNLVRTVAMEDKAGWVWDHFNVSFPMSTYLVAFIVSDFANEQSNSSLSNARFRVWARSEAIHQAEYAKEIGPKILTFFEDYYDTPFPLPKQDMVALPDFSAGAMENWGLITYRETALLYQEGVSSSANKQRVATVVSHELAHQWFGDLVTPKWWTDLWLNEGFASYVEYLGVNEVEPDWQMMEQFVTDEVQNVFSLDALETSHPISVPVGNPDEINEIFDRISYGKGASIIRMMDHFMTTSTFRKGLSNYLKNLAFQNSEQDDLWGYLTHQAHVDKTMPENMNVKEIMDTWTLQMGFPVIKVERDYTAKTARLHQKRFLLQKAEKSSDSHKYLWWVPLTYTTKANPNFSETKPKVWMNKNEEVITIPNIANRDDWVIFNIQETGYYRVNYDAENWNLLLQQLQTKHSAIGTINRAQIIDDALNLARAQQLSYATALNTTKFLKNDLSYLPWDAGLTALSYIKNMLVTSGGFDKFRTYVLDLLNPLYNDVTFEETPGENILRSYTRSTAISWACNLQKADCVKSASQLYSQWMNKTNPDTENPISPNLKQVVYCNAIKRGGIEEWEFAWERYQKSNVGSEKDTLLSAMGCSNEVWVLSRYLERTITENSGIRKQDAGRVFGSVAANPIGRPLAFDFMRYKWTDINAYLGKGMFVQDKIVASATRYLNKNSELEKLIEFKEEHSEDLGSAARATDQAIEKVKSNVQWMSSNYDAVMTWLEENKP